MKNFDSFDIDYRPKTRRATGGVIRFVFRGDIGSSGPSQTTTTTNPTSTSAGANSPVYSTAGARSPVNTGTQLTLGKGSTYTTSDPQVTQSAFDTISAIVKSAISAVQSGSASATTTAQDNAASNNALLQAVLKRDQSTAASVATGGTSDLTATITKIAIGALAVVAAIAFFWRKRA